jgi:hypothetical protein
MSTPMKVGFADLGFDIGGSCFYSQRRMFKETQEPHSRFSRGRRIIIHISDVEYLEKEIPQGGSPVSRISRNAEFYSENAVFSFFGFGGTAHTHTYCPLYSLLLVL